MNDYQLKLAFVCLHVSIAGLILRLRKHAHSLFALALLMGSCCLSLRHLDELEIISPSILITYLAIPFLGLTAGSCLVLMGLTLDKAKQATRLKIRGLKSN